MPKRVSRTGAGLRRVVTEPEKWLFRMGLRPGAAPHLPDFLCIGAQKAGTTWLVENLRHHPEVFIPRPQSTHYFDRHFHRSIGFYSSKFEEGASKVKGESCPAYAVLSRPRIRAVRALMPRVRIIFMMRNPIERAWSHAVMGLVQRPRARFEDVAGAAFAKHFSGRRSRQRSDYLTVLDNWLAAFPEDQVHVEFFDDVLAHPQELLRRVFRHLGISEAVDCSTFPYRQVINKGLGITMPEEHRRTLEVLYRDPIERLYERFGDRVASWRCS